MKCLCMSFSHSLHCLKQLFKHYYIALVYLVRFYFWSVVWYLCLETFHLLSFPPLQLWLIMERCGVTVNSLVPATALGQDRRIEAFPLNYQRALPPSPQDRPDPVFIHSSFWPGEVILVNHLLTSWPIPGYSLTNAKFSFPYWLLSV